MLHHLRQGSSRAPWAPYRVGAWLAMLFVSVLALGQSAPAVVPAGRQASQVAVITVDGGIDGLMSLSVQRRMKTAVDSGADAIVFEIDSPGGEIGAVLEISAAIKSSAIPNTVAWVNPQAYSGGAIIALACREIVTSDPAAMGDAFPVTVGMEGLRGLSPDERTKLLPPLLQDVTESARRNGYDEFLVQVMVTDGIELWAARNTSTGELMLINEQEYIALFGQEPVRGRPILGSVPGARTRSLADRAADSNDDADDQEPITETESETPGEVAPASGVPEDPDELLAEPVVDPKARFQPAGPGVADLEQSVTDMLDVSTNRPDVARLNPADWEPAGYVTDGTAAVVLGADQLADFGVSSRVVNSDEELKAFFGASSLIRLNMSWSERLTGFLTLWPVRGVIIVVFLLALFLEMTHPGVSIPGAVALVALVALVAPPMLVGMAGWWELAAIVVGILLTGLEILVIPGFGVFGIAGVLLLFAGLIGTFVPDSAGFPGAPGRTQDLLYGAVTVLVATATAGVGMYFLGKHFGRLPILSRLVLSDAAPDEESELIDMMGVTPGPVVGVGDLGRALSPLRPSGTAEFDSEVVDVVADTGYIEPGTPVRVLQIDGYRVVVEAAPEDTHGGEHA